MVVRPRADWLDLASPLRRCALCTAATQYESDYLEAHCFQLVEQAEIHESAAAAVKAFCVTHTTALGKAWRRVGLPSKPLLQIHLAQLDEVATELSTLEHDDWLSRPECPLCVARNEVVLQCAQELVRSLAADDDRTASLLAGSGGLCAAHFASCWEVSDGSATLELLRRHQLDAVARLAKAARADPLRDEFDEARAQAVAARAIAITAF